MAPIRNIILGLAALSGRISGMVAGICILVTALIVTYEVVLRAFFNAPTEWVNEISVYLVLASAFLGFAPALASGKHINVDLLICRLSPQVNKLLKRFCSLLGLLFSLIFLSTSWDMAMNSYELGMLSTSTLRIPLYIPQLSLPLGFFLLTLQFVANLIDNGSTASGKEGHQ